MLKELDDKQKDAKYLKDYIGKFQQNNCLKKTMHE